ncbi:fibrinogen C domain-containing protein 1-A-like [Amphiura filiformis]|uniref:fibrinogen C domain-containing protein 1-A-like n=1 Tax=Amphiura filiformis TaxID=82378 RepID=UPI003B224BCB
MATIRRCIILSVLICCCCTCKPTKRSSPRQAKKTDKPDDVMLNDSPIVSAAIVDKEKSIQIINTAMDFSASKEDVLDLDSSTWDDLRGDVSAKDLKSLDLIEATSVDKDKVISSGNSPEQPSSAKDSKISESGKPNDYESSSNIESNVKLLGPLELKESKIYNLDTSTKSNDFDLGVISTPISPIDVGTSGNKIIDKIMDESNGKLVSIASSLDKLVNLLQGMQHKTDRMFHNMSDTIGTFFTDGKKFLQSYVAPTPTPPPRDCTDIAADGYNASDSYTITPDGTTSYKVICELESDGGGWPGFQRRFDGSVDFYRDWRDYENGFGKPFGEHWAGLQLLHALTKTGTWELLVELEDFNGNLGFAHYDSFRVADKESGYRLSVGAYDGTVGDAMTLDNHNRQFSTQDQDNDWRSWGNCAQYRKRRLVVW